MNRCVFASLERALYIYVVGGATSTAPPCCSATKTQNEQTSRERFLREFGREHRKNDKGEEEIKMRGKKEEKTAFSGAGGHV